MLKFIGTLAAMMLLSACDVSIGKDEASEDSGSNAAARASASPAAGKAEEGELSIKAPGFDMKVNLPKGVTEHAGTDGDSKLVYPGSSIGGLHIEAGADKSAGRESGVELRFKSQDPFRKVAGWYRDPARREGFSIVSEKEEGAALVIAGTQKGDSDPFTLQLSASADGGTEGRLTLSDTN